MVRSPCLFVSKHNSRAVEIPENTLEIGRCISRFLHSETKISDLFNGLDERRLRDVLLKYAEGILGAVLIWKVPVHEGAHKCGGLSYKAVA